MTLAAAVAGVLVLLLLATGGLVVARVVLASRREARDRRRADVEARFRTDVLTLAAGEHVEIPEAVARLSALHRADWTVIEPRVLSLLATVRGESVRPILQVLSAQRVALLERRQVRSWNPVRRGQAVHRLGLLRDVESRAAIQKALRDADRDVRIAAARALGRIGSPTSAAPLLAALHGSRHVPASVVAVAVAALGPEALDTVAASLESHTELVRIVCADVAGLVAAGATEIVPALCNTLRNDHSAVVREHAALALERIGDVRAVPYFTLALRRAGSTRVRIAAAQGLGSFGEPAHAAELEAVLAEGGLLAEAAAAALLRLGEAGRETLQRNADRHTAAAAALTLLALSDGA